MAVIEDLDEYELPRVCITGDEMMSIWVGGEYVASMRGVDNGEYKGLEVVFIR